MGTTYAQRECANILFRDITTGKPFLYMDYALVTTNEHSADTNYASGGIGAPRRLGFDGNRQSTMTVSSQIFDFRMIALLAGATVVTGATNVFKREVLTAADDSGSVKITLAETPVSNTITIFPIAKDCVATEEVAHTVAGKVVTLTAGVDKEQYVVYYQFETAATAQKITFKSDKFPQYCGIIADTLVKNESTGINEAFQMAANKAKISPNFSLTFQGSGDPMTIDLTFDIFPDSNNEMITYSKYA